MKNGACQCQSFVQASWLASYLSCVQNKARPSSLHISLTTREYLSPVSLIHKTVRDCFVHEKKKMRIVKKAKITSQTFCGWRWHFGRSLHTLPNLLLNIGESPELWLSRKCFYSLDLRSFFPQALGRQENIMLIWNHFRGPDQAVFWPAKAETEK